MPYSKNPTLYPPEIQQLPELLSRATQDAYHIPADDKSHAAGRRTQIQAYFAAIRHKAQEMRTLAQKMATQRVKVAQLTPATNQATAPSAQRTSALRTISDDIADAERLADDWEGKAALVAGWMVKVWQGVKPEHSTHAAWYVEISRRTTGDFGKSLLSVFGAEAQLIGDRSTKDAAPMPPAPDPAVPCDEFGPIPATSEGASPADIARMIAWAQRQAEGK